MTKTLDADESSTAFCILLKIISDIAYLEFKTAINKRKRQSNAYWQEVLLGAPVLNSKPRALLTPTQHFIYKLSCGLQEINRTIRLMRNIEYYMTHVPRLKRGPSKVDYLGYQVECHLHEIYILRVRIESFTKVIERAYRKERSSRRIAAAMNRIRRASKRVLEPAVRIRGDHVHARRLRAPDFERLEFIQQIAKQAPSDSRARIDRIFASTYLATRKYRLEAVREMNTACESLLDYAAGQCASVLFSRGMTRFEFPSGLERDRNQVRL